jgi:hypothetical protein
MVNLYAINFVNPLSVIPGRRSLFDILVILNIY